MRRWRRCWSSLVDVLRRSRLERDIDDELRFHVESEIGSRRAAWFERRGRTPGRARQSRRHALSFVRNAMAAGASGLAIGMVLSMMLARLLASMLYGVRSGDVPSLIAAGLLMLAVTGVAAWVSAVRATRVPTVHVLRT